MKKLVVFIFLLLCLTQLSASGPDTMISCHFKEVTFSEFCQLIYRESGVRVFYQESRIARLKVTLEADSISVLEAVSQAVKGSGLEISIWNNNLVLLPGEKLLAKLPDFESKHSEVKIEEKESKSLTASEERYLTARKPEVIKTLRVGRSGASTSGVKARVLGRVLDLETGEPVYNATIYLEETRTGAVSDVNGFITIMLKPGNYTALFNFLGYEKKKYLLEVFSDGDFSLQMKKTVYQLEEFVIHGDRQLSITDKDPGLDKVAMQSIKEMPMLMGERDILKVATTLPGIVTAGEGSSGLNVRGGGADQNAFYINKIPVYNTSHMFGFFPAFNSDIIKDFSIYKGHIPVQYGGRLSSVFNIITRQGNRKNFTAHGGSSPVSANLVLEGPLKKDISSVFLSARSTYSDWILKRIKDPVIRGSKAGFYDFSGGLSFDNRKTQLSLFAYHSNDRFQLSDINEYNYSNSGASINVSRNLTRTLRAEFALVAAQYAFHTINNQEVSAAYQHAYQMGHYEFRTDFKQVLSDRNTLDYGIDILFYQLDRGTVEPYGLQSLHTHVELGEEKGLESAFYISDDYDILSWLNFTAGLRFTLFTPMGPGRVYLYSEGLPVDPGYTSDSLDFGKNEVIKWYPEPDLRAALNMNTDINGSLKLAFNQMHQNLFMLNNTVSVSPNAQWKLADYHLLPSKSDQLSLGVFRVLGIGLEMSAELYYKQSLNYPEFKDGASFLESPLLETIVLQGTQKSAGIEFFIKRSHHRLEGWMTYTYSRSLVKVNGGEVWNSINHGEAFPANFDIPHVFNLVLNYHLSRRVTFSTVVTYQSGKPITYPVSAYYVDEVPKFDYSSRNAYRIPHYFRTDLSCTVEGSLKKNKLIHSSLNFSVYNLSGRENPYAVYFNVENKRINGYQYAVIGVPIFTASWIFKLGNYASD